MSKYKVRPLVFISALYFRWHVSMFMSLPRVYAVILYFNNPHFIVRSKDNVHYDELSWWMWLPLTILTHLKKILRELRVNYTKQMAYYSANYSWQNGRLTFCQWTIKFQKCTVQTSCVQHHIMMAETHTRCHLIHFLLKLNLNVRITTPSNRKWNSILHQIQDTYFKTHTPSTKSNFSEYRM
jgi:hypothetical protein